MISVLPRRICIDGMRQEVLSRLSGKPVTGGIVSLLIASALLIVRASTAEAQDLATVKQGAKAQPAILADEFNEPSTDHLLMGLGVSVAPVLQGGSAYRVLPVPMFDYSKGRLFANVGDGIGVNVLNSPIFTVGTSITYLPGYRARDVPSGIGALDVGIGARGFVITRLLGASITTGVTKGFLGGNRGLVIDAGLSMSKSLSKRVILTPSVSTTWVNPTYNERYFGVTAKQAQASGLPAFKPRGGFKDVSLDVTMSYLMSTRFILGVTGSVTSLIGDAKRSPLVKNSIQPSSFAYIAYSF